MTLLEIICGTMIEKVLSQGARPVLLEIRFTKGAIEALDRDVLRGLGGITSLCGLPVVYPEEPGAGVERAAEFTLQADRGYVAFFATVEQLNCSALPVC